MGGSKRVLQVFGSLNVGGAECRMMDVYRRIDRESIQFDFITMQHGDQFFQDEIESLGGKVFQIRPPREAGIFGHLNELRQCMKKQPYCAVHAHTSYHCGLVMLAAWLESIPIRITHARTTQLTTVNWKEKIMLFLGRVLIRFFSNQRLAISKDAGQFLFGNKSFLVIPNAIDVKAYTELVDKEKIRLELRIPVDSVVIGQIGRFDRGKNHRFSIEWFSKFEKVYPMTYLVLVGDGETKEEIQQLVEQKHFKNRVIFTGVRDDVPRLIHAFDLLLFPSLYEGLGGVALEAQAAGVPVVESEGLPIETDLGLNMVERCSLNAPYSVWDEAVIRGIKKDIPSVEVREKAFNDHRLSIESTTAAFVNIYRGEFV